MSRPDVFASVRRPKPATESFDLKCSVSEATWPIKVQRLTTVQVMEASEMGGEYYAYHVTGSGPLLKDGPHKGELDTGSPQYLPPVPLPPVDGQPVSLSKSTARMLCAILLAQAGSKSEHYRFEELVALSCSNEVALQMMEVHAWIMPEENSGNSASNSGTPASTA